MLKTFAVLVLFSAPLAAQEVSTDTATELPTEVVIKSQAEDRIRTPKPPLQLKVDDFESVRKSLSPDKDLFLFESAEYISISRSYPDKLRSERVLQPWRTAFSDKTNITIYPRRKFSEVFSRSYTEKSGKELQWTVSITDSEGKIFHKYSGNGLPPEILEWTGENDQKEWIRAGHSYAPVYVFVDEYGSPKTVMGELIKFTAIVHQKGDNLHISLDSTAVFGPTKSLREMEKPAGEALLAATSDLIKRRYYGTQLKVNVYAQTRDLAEIQAENIKNFLKKQLMAPESLITFEGFEDTYAQQRVDIVVLNR